MLHQANSSHFGILWKGQYCHEHCAQCPKTSPEVLASNSIIPDVLILGPRMAWESSINSPQDVQVKVCNLFDGNN